MEGDGYIQSKQRELNETLLATKQKAELLEKRIEVVNKTIENYEQLITMLKKQEEFNNDTQKRCEKIVEEIANEYNKKMQERTDAFLRKNAKENLKKITSILKQTKETLELYENKFKKADGFVSTNNFLIHLVFRELLKKKIMTYDDFTSIEKLKLKFEEISGRSLNELTPKTKGELKRFFTDVFGDFVYK